MEEERIKRIARAMCRAARLDPDKPADESAGYTMMIQHPGAKGIEPAWTLFRQQAELFAARHREVVGQL
jgi:hypothetical protein